MKKLLLIIHTIRHLRPIQIRYQLWYRLRTMWRKAVGFKHPLSKEKEANPLTFAPWIEKPVSYISGACTFLNQTETNPSFEKKTRGALWTYNLNYMDYLLQPGMDAETGLNLIDGFIQTLPQNPTGLEPYPIALRGINWIKFLSRTVVARESEERKLPKQSPQMNASAPSKPCHCEERPKEATKQTADKPQTASSLYAQYLILLNNPEYHLLGNHLLEDGFSLLFGGFYFSDRKLYNTGSEIVKKELEEQILEDGAHFELSPMYHQIILDRLLDCINLLQNNPRFEGQNNLLGFMEEKAVKMLAWLNTITFSNGEIPLLNDSAPGIAPTTRQLNDYASRLNLRVIRENLCNSCNSNNSCNLCSSGYRKFTIPAYECIIDIGQIGPSYQPGHAHADTFNFVLNVKNEPVLVDSGISTYEANKTRLNERGTAAHNTVTVRDKNSSEVWSSFRVANRAEVKILKDDTDSIIAQHNGFRKLKTTHQREWQFDEEQIVITDTLIGMHHKGIAHFHLAPGQTPEKSENTIRLKNSLIKFNGDCNVKLVKSQIPNGYNQFSVHYKIEVSFNEQLKSYIILNG